ncbi:MAG: hypothetical protein M3Y81_25660, partial [Chloroflexota bacterium]|nr:hypothetical protein [Chloroflexota bacterium]
VVTGTARQATRYGYTGEASHRPYARGEARSIQIGSSLLYWAHSAKSDGLACATLCIPCHHYRNNHKGVVWSNAA